MPAWIRRIGTKTPAFSFAQEDASRKMQEWARSDRERRIIRALYRASGIERRHSVIENFDAEPDSSFFRKDADGAWRGPGTAARNDVFARESKALSVALARETVAACPGIGPGEITHVVTASCTGFYNPGPDIFIVRELGLPHSTQRYHLGFMGCYAAFPALRMAAQSLYRSHSALGVFFRRMRAKLGAPKAITATAHKLARIVYHLLTTREPYAESQLAKHEELYRKRLESRLYAQARVLGYQLVPVTRQSVS